MYTTIWWRRAERSSVDYQMFGLVEKNKTKKKKKKKKKKNKKKKKKQTVHEGHRVIQPVTLCYFYLFILS